MNGKESFKENMSFCKLKWTENEEFCLKRIKKQKYANNYT